jgi:hypothetical protein
MSEENAQGVNMLNQTPGPRQEVLIIDQKFSNVEHQFELKARLEDALNSGYELLCQPVCYVIDDRPWLTYTFVRTVIA